MDESSRCVDPGRQVSPGVRPARIDGFTRICFDRPPVNAFTMDMFGQFHALMMRLREDPGPVLLTGTGGTFSAGFDIKQPGVDGPGATEAARRCVAAVRDHPAPVVAAVEGAAVGFGLLVAMSADILVVSRSARLRMPEVILGVDSDVAPLRRFLPDPWIRRMCLVGEAFTATDLRLDHCAGATVCEPGMCEEAAAAVLESIAEIDVSFLRRAKRRLGEMLFNGDVDSPEG
jgi:enoyl-CoA hydratase